MDLFRIDPGKHVACDFWFLKRHFLTMADERRSFQFLDNEKQ